MIPRDRRRSAAPTTGARLSPAAPSIVALQAKAGEATTLLRALGNADRLLLLCHLVDTERSVSELGSLTGIGQPSLSQQLGVLRGEQLVDTRRDGKHVVYRIASPAALAVLQTLYGLFCQPEPDPPRMRRPSLAATRRTRKVSA